VTAELTTPTGAAIVTTLAEPPGGPPALVARRTGYGAGSRDRADPPNCLRLTLGDALSAGVDGGAERLVQIETHIDDMNPQIYGWLEEQLLGAGARDVFLTAVIMKKGRPGTLVTCLADEGRVEALTAVLLRETTTLGVRSWPVERRVLERSAETVATSLGSVRVKRVRTADGREDVRPEYEDCRRLAAEHGLALREVLARVTLEVAPEGVAERGRID
jgi:uncharacterized protein (DUF111 family)